MSKPFDVREQLAAFTGWAPLFPLPNVVHFPHLLLPLHIFEPRYRQMVGDSMEGSRLIAMALLKPGFATTEGSPPIHDTVCLGRITAEQTVPDGRYYLVLQGLSRARIVREAASDKMYRIAELTLHPDPETVASETAAAAQRRRLIGAFPQALSAARSRPRAAAGDRRGRTAGNLVRRAGRRHVARGTRGSESSDRARHQSALWIGSAADPRQAAATDEGRPDDLAA